MTQAKFEELEERVRQMTYEQVKTLEMEMRQKDVKKVPEPVGLATPEPIVWEDENHALFYLLRKRLRKP